MVYLADCKEGDLLRCTEPTYLESSTDRSCLQSGEVFMFVQLIDSMNEINFYKVLYKKKFYSILEIKLKFRTRSGEGLVRKYEHVI